MHSEIVKMENIYYPYIDYKLLVQCMTYNHSKYIEDTLMGFAIQQTNFPFVCLVMDDCSTDGEQEVIKSWMNRECEMSSAQFIEKEISDIIIVPHKKNLSCTFAFYFLKENLYKTKKKTPLIDSWLEKCEYTAACEGDDYWTSPEKLQLSVDFLNEHLDYSVVCHRFKRYHDEEKVFYDDDKGYLFKNESEGITFKKGFGHFMTQTLCTTYRVRDLDEFNQFPGVHTDSVLGHFLLKKGKGYCFNKYMAVYRYNGSSVWSEISFKEKTIWNYNMYKSLYEYEKDWPSRMSYYSQYVSALFVTKGGLLFKERLDILKLLYIPYFSLVKIFRYFKRKLNN